MNFRVLHLHSSWQELETVSLCGPLIAIPNIHRMPRDSIISIFWGLCNSVLSSYHYKAPGDGEPVTQCQWLVVHNPAVDSARCSGHNHTFYKGE